MLRNLFIIVLSLISYNLFAQEQPLPRSMTPAERLIWDDYLKNYPKDRGTNPPVGIPRTPGEWE
ncbi:MAG TPA: hypothetical protein PL017_03895, partial [Tenuifilaceae bacterium]|nr:hypothetical protein [Tenuifilaceae bacterium]HPQ33339.1 hypothetical protein [Tenuifilaceae bacterium]HRX68978.1 hypothetical protein [Tenuifilaceae bacterium]